MRCWRAFISVPFNTFALGRNSALEPGLTTPHGIQSLQPGSTFLVESLKPEQRLFQQQIGARGFRFIYDDVRQPPNTVSKSSWNCRRGEDQQEVHHLFGSPDHWGQMSLIHSTFTPSCTFYTLFFPSLSPCRTNSSLRWRPLPRRWTPFSKLFRSRKEPWMDPPPPVLPPPFTSPFHFLFAACPPSSSSFLSFVSSFLFSYLHRLVIPSVLPLSPILSPPSCPPRPHLPPF